MWEQKLLDVRLESNRRTQPVPAQPSLIPASGLSLWRSDPAAYESYLEPPHRVLVLLFQGKM